MNLSKLLNVSLVIATYAFWVLVSYQKSGSYSQAVEIFIALSVVLSSLYLIYPLLQNVEEKAENSCQRREISSISREYFSQISKSFIHPTYTKVVAIVTGILLVLVLWMFGVFLLSKELPSIFLLLPIPVPMFLSAAIAQVRDRENHIYEIFLGNHMRDKTQLPHDHNEERMISSLRGAKEKLLNLLDNDGVYIGEINNEKILELLQREYESVMSKYFEYTGSKREV